MAYSPQMAYSAGSEPKRTQPYTTDAGITNALRNIQPAGGNSSVPSPKPPSASTSNNAPGSGGGASPPPAFDLNADPVLQQVQAQVTAGNSQAQSGALSQEEQALLQLGDPALAASILGSSDPMVQAAANNPMSTDAQLRQQYQQQLQNFGETIDPSLVDSGYRVMQEGNLAQNLQQQLAQAASGFQNTYQGIQGQLASTEAQNAGTLSSAWSDAYNRALQGVLGGLYGSVNTSGPNSLASMLAALGGGS